MLLVVHMAFNPPLDTNMAKLAFCMKDYFDRKPLEFDSSPPNHCFRVNMTWGSTDRKALGVYSPSLEEPLQGPCSKMPCHQF